MGTPAPLLDDDPAVLGRWRLVGRLGAGGMATVYLGLATDGGRQQAAAVKVAHAHIAAHEEFRLRFRREVEICGRVRGGQVAELLDAEPTATRPWLAVRFVPGPTVAEHVVEHGPLEPAPLRAFALATLAALGQLHAAGVVHRDLKASNVILTATGPVIIDFGIAHATEVTSLTATRASMGTPGWMSPEQIAGAPAGPPTDVFAWGVLVALAATGRLPWGGGPPDALAYRIVHGTPDLTGLDGPVGRDGLRDAVRAALHPEAARRPDLPALERMVLGAGGGGGDGGGGGTAPGDVATTLATAVDRDWAQAATRFGLPDAAALPPLPPAHSAATSGRRRVVGAAVAGAVLAVAAGATLALTVGDGSSGTGPTAASSSAPAEPALSATLTSAPADSARLRTFLTDHEGQVVRLDVTFVGGFRELSVDQAADPPYVFVCSARLEQQECLDGLSITITDLGDSDALLVPAPGGWALEGRFAVRAVTGPDLGTVSAALRALYVE